MQRTRLSIVCVTAVGAGLVWATPSMALIVTGRSIGGVQVGATEAAVQRVIGKPKQRYCHKLKRSGRIYTACTLLWPAIGFQVYAVDKRVVQVSIRSAREKTNRGINTGDSIDAAQRAYADCRKEPFTHCIVGKTGHTGDRYMYIQYVEETVGIIAVGRWDRRFACSIAHRVCTGSG